MNNTARFWITAIAISCLLLFVVTFVQFVFCEGETPSYKNYNFFNWLMQIISWLGAVCLGFIIADAEEEDRLKKK